MEGDIFHIINRGVDKRKVFFEKNDYFRFIYSLHDFNSNSVTAVSYFNRRNSAMRKPKKDSDKLVDVLCWCLMPNHYHVLVQEKTEGGASLFSKKISSGYTQYFNLKNERSGVLFQGRSKIIKVIQDNHFMYLPYYIFANPVKLIDSNWKERGIKDFKQVEKYLDNYLYSSYKDIIDTRKLSFVVNKDLFFERFTLNREAFRKDFLDWLFGYAKAEN